MRRAAWAAWCLVVLGLFNTCSTHREAWSTGRWLQEGRFEWSLATAIRALRAASTDDGDINRYFAYSNAVAGRPYQGRFVKPLDEWRAAAPPAIPDIDLEDPDVTPPVRPPGRMVPYRDFSVEYPPGLFLVILPIALVAQTMDSYFRLFSIVMGLLLTLALILCVRMARRLSPARAESADSIIPWATGAALCLGTVLVRRYDAVIALSLCILVWGCMARRPVPAGLGFGLGVVAKGVPLLIAPIPMIHWIARRRWRELAIAAAAALGLGLTVGLPFLRAAGTHMLDLLRYHAERPLQVESTGAALLMVGRIFVPGSAAPSQGFGSTNVVGSWDGPLRAAAGVMPVIALIAVFAWAARASRRSDKDAILVVIRAICAALVAQMTLGKVFSPQYLTWIFPLAVLISVVDGGARRGLLLAALGLTQIIFPFCYHLGLIYVAHPALGALVLARNTLLMAWAVRVLRAAS